MIRYRSGYRARRYRRRRGGRAQNAMHRFLATRRYSRKYRGFKRRGRMFKAARAA